MEKIHNLILFLKEIRNVDDLEIKDYALDSLIERLEEQQELENNKTKEQLEKNEY